MARLFCHGLPASLRVRVEDLLCVCYWGSAGAARMSRGTLVLYSKASRPGFPNLGTVATGDWIILSSVCVCVSFLCVSWPLTTRCQE